MEWMGLITLAIIYGCLFTAVVTGVFSWALLTVWCIPVLSLAVSYKEGMEINGLMVVLCFLMFMGCRRGLLEACMWNLKLRKDYGALFYTLYSICLLFLYYSFWQAQAMGYLWDIQGTNDETINYFRLIGTSIPIFWVAYPLTELFYNGIDRLFKKERELVLLNCKFFLADSKGGDRGLFKGCYLDGIHNGVNYHFRLTSGIFEKLKNEKNLRLKIKVGLLRGLYVEENPCPENAQKIKLREKRQMRAGVIFLLAILGCGIWFFWFY